MILVANAVCATQGRNGGLLRATPVDGLPQRASLLLGKQKGKRRTPASEFESVRG